MLNALVVQLNNFQFSSDWFGFMLLNFVEMFEVFQENIRYFDL